MTGRELQQHTYLQKQELDDALRVLVDAGEVQEEDGGGRTIYSLREE